MGFEVSKINTFHARVFLVLLLADLDIELKATFLAPCHLPACLLAAYQDDNGLNP